MNRPSAEERAQVHRRVLAELNGVRPVTLRPAQVIGDGPRVLLAGGRQSGKTFGASEWMAERIAGSEDEFALVGPTFGQGRAVMVEHPKSGLLVALRRRGIHVVRHGRGEWKWNRSDGELLQGNRVAARIDGASEGLERIQGHSIAAYWFDELRLVKDKPARQALNESLEYALSGSEHPQRVLTTATRTTLLIRELMKDPTWDTRVLPMRANWANLPVAYLEQMEERRGTRMGRQELDGELLGDIEGALWHSDWIDHVDRLPAGAAPGGTLRSLSLGLDAAGGEGGSRQAMVAAGLGWDNRIYVVHADARRESVDAWLKRAIRTAQELHADRMCVERNHGDRFLVAALEHAMADMGVRVPYQSVWVAQSKAERAVPIATLYETGKVTHVGELAELDVELESFTGAKGDLSDLVDALVHACNDLMGYGSRPGGEEQYGAVPYGEQAVEGGAVGWG